MPSDYEVTDVRGYTLWSDIQRAVVVCMDSGGYAQLHRKGFEPVHVWCFKEKEDEAVHYKKQTGID